MTVAARIARAAVAALLALLGAAAHGAEHVVRPGESIAAAVRLASAGDTVAVERGDYVENIVIDKPLRLLGRNRPTVSGADRGDVIRVKSPDVAIEGFIIRDSGRDLTAQNAGIYVEPGAHRPVIRANDLAYNLFGAWVEGVETPVIQGNLITGLREVQSAQRGNGIQLYNTRGAQVLDNHISFTRDGIYVDVSHHALFRGNRMHHVRYGTHYMNSYYNVWEKNETYLNRGGLALMEVRDQVVRDNLAWGNTDHGIMLRTIQDAVVERNVVIGNGKGFFVYDAEYNTLRDNLVMGNRVGVHLWAGSYRNAVDGNDFINNHEQIRYVASRDQRWGLKRGNYWSNYTGWDRDGDGAGDTAYEANDIVDRLTTTHPIVKLLIASPAVQALRAAARAFPLLRAPSIVELRPRMRPHHADWRRWLEHGGH
ncbi:MAG: nitrous oxide reductase family maturation protein NosD [Burkholderiales bacterium]|nr:nitrous oxide reductase family maturation protein NosD [Burkholderiales bacterium]